MRRYFAGLILALLALHGSGFSPAGGQAWAGEDSLAGLTVVRIDVVGCETLTPQQIKYKMGTREGKPLDPRILEADFKRLSDMEAIADVQIDDERVEGGVRLIVKLREKGLIRRIAFRGNQQVKRARLESLIQAKVGARYDAGQANRDKRAIEDWYREEFYYFAEVKFETEPFEDGVSLVFTIDEGGRLYVQEIAFRGNKHFSYKELLKFMETRPSSFFTRGRYDRRTFEKDLARIEMLYKKEGFLDVKVIERPFQITANKPESRWQRRDAYVYIDIEEGDRYKVGRIDFEGNKLVATEELRAVLETTPGEWFSIFAVQSDARKIRDIYGQYPSSRYFTKVLGDPVITPEGPVMDVLFKIDEGEEVIVEDVQIVGLEKTQDRVARRVIAQLPGEKIDSRKINESLRNLRNLGYFKEVNLDVKEGSAPNRARVVADLEEGTTGKLQLGAGISSKESFIGSIELSQQNFWARGWPDSWKDFFLGKAFCGAGQHFNALISAGSKSQNLKLDWTEPWLFDRPISLGLSGFYKSWEYRRYDEERTGGMVRLGKRLWHKNLWGSIAYKLEQVVLEDFDANVSNELLREKGDNTISRAILNVSYDTRDSRFDPVKGILLSGTQELAGLGGTRDFWRSFLEGQLFHPFFHDKRKRPWYVALRAEMGAAEAYGDDEHVPLYEKMFAGGIGSIRGFSFHTISPKDAFGDEVGGELMATASAEVFVPLYEDIIRVSGFYDTGSVWAQLDDSESDPWRSSVGIGVHIRTPLGPMPIRLYYSWILDSEWADDQQHFQFTFGANF